MNNYDFSGWATRNDMKCADGRTIRRNAFIGNDGQTVPLVWQHKHDDPKYVLGHALLENNAEGVYAYCTLNNGPMGRQAAELVANGDVSHLSIYANQLKQSPSGDVMHGVIRELSLVLSGANPGAYIDHCTLTHSGEADMCEAEIYNDWEDGLEIYHSDMDEYDDEDVEDSEDFDEEYDDSEEDYEEDYDDEDSEAYDEEDYDDEDEDYDPDVEDSEDYDDEYEEDSEEPQEYEEYEEIHHSGMEEMTMENATLGDIIATMNEDQQDALAYVVGTILEEAENSAAEGANMKHNVFESEEDYMAVTDELMHSAMGEIIEDARNAGSMRESFLRHADDYGITNIDYLFPDYETIGNTPEFIKRKTEWVAKVMGSVHHTPFARIKSVFADITEDEARAKGYIKGNLKKDEVFTLLKRTTDPQTIYKKQRMDRDDIVDITDFDVVSWIKTEMRMMLDEEIARAILIGDGRLTSSNDHINHSHVRPIWHDADLYTIHVPLTVGTDETVPEAMIRLAIQSRKQYRGTGTPTLFTTEDALTNMLLLKDRNRRYIYDNQSQLATTLRVSDIVTVPVMEEITADGLRKDAQGKVWKVVGLIVNLADYNVGADKGGSVNMFDDFDIDYNQQKYLIETRCSGALTKPYSAIAIEVEVEVNEETGAITEVTGE